MKKGEIYKLEIEDMSSEGQGIGRVFDNEYEDRAGSLVVFVPGVISGDILKVELTRVKKNYAFGKPIELIEESPERSEESYCKYAPALFTGETQAEISCGGCPYAGINYDLQLAIKENQVKNKLVRIAGAREDLVRSIVPADFAFRYRNKAAMAISTGGLMTRKGGIVEPVHEPRIGFRPAKSKEVMDCENCAIQAETANAAAEATRRYMLEDNIPSFDTRWDKGLMKNMVVKTAFGTGEVMVVYEIHGKGIPNGAKLIEYLDDEIYEVGGNLESVVIKTDKGNSTLAGKPTITDVVTVYDSLEDACNSLEDESIQGRELSFEISPDSFYQVNQMQMQKLYSIVRQMCIEIGRKDGDKKPNILDLYCGIGTIGLSVADLANHVHGIEIVKEAIINANRNATINGIVNATYECGKAEKIIPSWLEEGEADIAILDPPRAGCKPELLEAIGEARIPNIVYVSCDPATLARDIKILADMGYRLVEAIPVDMFPNTSAVETVVLLSR